MAKASLAAIRKAENEDWVRLGTAVERTRGLLGLTLQEFASAIDKDERQVARWIAGTERTQVDAIFAVAHFQRAFVIALAEQAQGVDVVTEIRVPRSA